MKSAPNLNSVGSELRYEWPKILKTNTKFRESIPYVISKNKLLVITTQQYEFSFIELLDLLTCINRECNNSFHSISVRDSSYLLKGKELVNVLIDVFDAKLED